MSGLVAASAISLPTPPASTVTYRSTPSASYAWPVMGFARTAVSRRRIGVIPSPRAAQVGQRAHASRKAFTMAGFVSLYHGSGHWTKYAESRTTARTRSGCRTAKVWLKNVP